MKYLISIIAIALALNLNAKSDSTKHIETRKIHKLAVQIGTDVGGAMPSQLSFIPKTFRPIPSIRPNLGVKYSIAIHRMLDITAELNYKHIAMNADAIVKNMRATLPQPDGTLLVQYFSGRASMNMSFDIMEVPVYLKIKIPKNNKNNIIFGPYFAWNIKSHFLNNPIDGFVGTAPDVVDAIINPETQLPAEQKDFSKFLSNWDWGLSLGYEREIFKRFDIALRFSIGLKDIFDVKVLEYSMNTIRGTVTVSYDIFRF